MPQIRPSGWVPNSGAGASFGTIPDLSGAAQQTGGATSKWIQVAETSTPAYAGEGDYDVSPAGYKNAVTGEFRKDLPAGGEVLEMLNPGIKEESLGINGAALYKGSDGYYLDDGYNTPRKATNITDSMIPGLLGGAKTRQDQNTAAGTRLMNQMLMASLAVTGVGAFGSLASTAAAAGTTGLSEAAIADIIAAEGGYSALASSGMAGTAAATSAGKSLMDWALPLAETVGGAIAGGVGADSDPAGTTTTVQDLPDWLKPYVTGNLDAAKKYMDANPQDNSLLAPARSELNKSIAGDYLNSNPANPFFTGAQGYTNPGLTELGRGAGGAYSGQNPGDAGYREAQGYTNPAIAALRSGASGSFMGLNPADAGYRQAQNYTNQGIAALQPGASGAYVGTNPGDAGYRDAQKYTNAGIDLLRPAASGAYVGQNPSDPYYRQAANYTNTSMDYLRPTAEGKFLNANPYIDAVYGKARDAVGTGIDSRFSMAGRYGSGAHQGVLGTTFNNLATDIYGNNYARERENMLSAGGTLISADQAQQAARLAGASGLSGNYQNDRATQLAAAGNLGTLDQAQQAARLAGTQGLSTNYANDRNLQFNYGQALTSADAAQQAARLAGTQGLSSNYNTERSLQANYAQNQAAAEQAQQAARLAGTAGLSSNYNADAGRQLDYASLYSSANQAQQAARLAAASGLSGNYNTARNQQLTAATSAPGFTADAATSPFAAFNAFGNLTKGLGVSQTSSPYFTNPTAGALSGALAGYGLSKAFA